MVAIHTGFDPNEARDAAGRWVGRGSFSGLPTSYKTKRLDITTTNLDDVRFMVEGVLNEQSADWLNPAGESKAEATFDLAGAGVVYVNRIDAKSHRGYGRELLAASEELFKQHGFVGMRTYIESNNLESFTMFSKMGYRKAEDSKTGGGSYWTKSFAPTTHAKEKPAYKTPNPLRADPSQTITIRRSFVSDLTKRYRTVRETINQALDYSTGWPAKTSKQKIAEMRRWLAHLTEQHIKTRGVGSTEPWLAKYVRQAYSKGTNRAFDATNFIQGTPAYKAGYREQFLTGHKRRYEEATELIVEESAERIQALTNDINSWAADEVSQVIRRKGSIKQIKAALKEVFERIIKAKAKLYVSDIIVGTHAEGMLDAYEDLGVEQVGVRAEWLTAQDDKVCPLCKRHEGLTYRIDEARGLIPLHPRCRCTWIPTRSNRADRMGRAVKAAAAIIKKRKLSPFEAARA